MRISNILLLSIASITLFSCLRPEEQGEIFEITWVAEGDWDMDGDCFDPNDLWYISDENYNFPTVNNSGTVVDVSSIAIDMCWETTINYNSITEVSDLNTMYLTLPNKLSIYMGGDVFLEETLSGAILYERK